MVCMIFGMVWISAPIWSWIFLMISWTILHRLNVALSLCPLLYKAAFNPFSSTLYLNLLFTDIYSSVWWNALWRNIKPITYWWLTAPERQWDSTGSYTSEWVPAMHCQWDASCVQGSLHVVESLLLLSSWRQIARTWNMWVCLHERGMDR